MKSLLISLLLLTGCNVAHADLINGVGMNNFVPVQEIYDQLATFDGGLSTGVLPIPGGCYSLDIILANEGTGTGAITQIYTTFLDGTAIELWTLPALVVDAGSITYWTPSASANLLGQVTAPGTGKGNIQSFSSITSPLLPNISIVVPANTNSQYRLAVLCGK